MKAMLGSLLLVLVLTFGFWLIAGGDLMFVGLTWLLVLFGLAVAVVS